MSEKSFPTLKIKELFPRLLTSSVTTVPANTETLAVIHTLLRDKLDVVLLKNGIEYPKGVSGYSIISGLTQFGGNFLRFLKEPCINRSLTLGTISYENDDLQSLLHTFETTSFGYAIVRTNGNSMQLVSIKDLLSLYGRGVLSSDLIVKDIASYPVMEVSRETKLLDCLSEMMQRKVRRLKIAHSQWELVTDRDILEFVFQTAPVNEIEAEQWIATQLIKPLSEMKLETAPWLEQKSTLEDAAKILLRHRSACALSQAGIITPSDLIIKPWRLGRLSFHW
jgi:hypothetical protein